MLYIKDIEQPDSPEFRQMLSAYWEEIMPKAYELQDDQRREEYFEERFIQKDDATYLQWIMKAEHPMGFLHFDILQKQKCAIVHDFYIMPEARRRGRGGAAIALFYEQVDEQGVERIDLNVRRDNPNALAFWESQGFGIASYRLRQFRDPQTGTAFEGSLSSDF